MSLLRPNAKGTGSNGGILDDSTRPRKAISPAHAVTAKIDCSEWLAPAEHPLSGPVRHTRATCLDPFGSAATGGNMLDHWICRARGALLALVAAGLLAGTVQAAPVAASSGTNSRIAREDALRNLPLAKVDSRLAGPIQRVIHNPSVFRRLPVQMLDCDPKLYHFLLNNPEVIVNIWRVMGITKVQMRRTGPITYEAADGDGAAGTLYVAYSDSDTQVVYCDGVYEGPMFSKPLRAQCVLLLKSGYTKQPNGRYLVTSRCDAFIHLESVGLELLARTFQPLVNKSADVNFIETAAFVSTVSRTSEVKPAGMAKLGGRLQDISPDVREQFIDLTQQVAERARRNRESLARNDGQH